MSHQIRDSDGSTGQQTLTAFARNTPGDGSGELWEFDEYGPTMGHPIPRGVFDQLPGTGLDERELIGTGGSASDWDRCKTRSTSDGGLYHLEDREDPAERDRFREMMKTQENSEESREDAGDGETPEKNLAFDPEAETVSHEWEGECLYTSWGYGQTNVDFAKIVEVSDTGKTVLAQMCRA